ncbi:hypothetical protein JHK85_048771 [Glycine max]|nr:hypothetical protein JHK85_048771 [Glycine max]
MAYLNEWVVLESDHIDGLSGVVEDLEASTLRHPLIGGAKVEGMNKLIYEVVVVSSREKAMLDEWKALIEFCDRYVGKSHDIWLKNLNGSSKKLDKDATTFPRYTGIVWSYFNAHFFRNSLNIRCPTQSLRESIVLGPKTSSTFVFAIVLLFALLFVTAVRGAAGGYDAAGCGCWSLLRGVVLLPVVIAGSGGCWVWVLVRCCSVSVRGCCAFQNILSGRVRSGQTNTYREKNKKGRYSAFPAIPS